MKLSNYEKETIILFNEDEPTARVETFNGRLIRELKKIEGCDGVNCEEKADGYAVYTIPKKLVKIRTPRQLSDEERAETVERLKAGREARRQNQF